ncbi:transcriptional regulator, MarR family with acetyltransferase activity, partial [mine drainage metagenome]
MGATGNVVAGAATPIGTAEGIEGIRDFNRFYTRQIGLLNQRFLSSSFTLTEARVLYELAQRSTSTATEIAGRLSLDPGYLSRLLNKLERQHYLNRGRAEHDARQRPLSLTKKGIGLFKKLDQTSSEAVAALIGGLSPVRVGEL